MADDLKDRGAQDRSRINVNEDHEVRYWTQKWGVSKEQLTAAVQKVGVSTRSRMSWGKDDHPDRRLLPVLERRPLAVGAGHGDRASHCAARAQPGLRRSCHRDPCGGLALSHRYQPRERGAAVDAGKIRRRKTD